MTIHADLGVTKSHSRPHSRNDNPLSDAHFEALQYRPDLPDRFASLQQARTFLRRLPPLVMTVRLHASIGYVTPDDDHDGRDEAIRHNWPRGLAAARQARFHHRRKATENQP